MLGHDGLVDPLTEANAFRSAGRVLAIPTRTASVATRKAGVAFPVAARRCATTRLRQPRRSSNRSAGKSLGHVPHVPRARSSPAASRLPADLAARRLRRGTFGDGLGPVTFGQESRRLPVLAPGARLRVGQFQDVPGTGDPT